MYFIYFNVASPSELVCSRVNSVLFSTTTTTFVNIIYKYINKNLLWAKNVTYKTWKISTVTNTESHLLIKEVFSVYTGYI